MDAADSCRHGGHGKGSYDSVSGNSESQCLLSHALTLQPILGASPHIWDQPQASSAFFPFEIHWYGMAADKDPTWYIGRWLHCSCISFYDHIVIGSCRPEKPPLNDGKVIHGFHVYLSKGLILLNNHFPTQSTLVWLENNLHHFCLLPCSFLVPWLDPKFPQCKLRSASTKIMSWLFLLLIPGERGGL